MKFKYGLIAALCGTLALTACNEEKAPSPVKMTQSQAAQKAADSVQFTDNQMINLLKKRLELLAKPGGITYIVTFNKAGQPVYYDAVEGRVGSCQQRLTPGDRVVRNDAGGSAWSYLVRQAPGDSGVWGPSAECVFWFGTDGVMKTWNGEYFISDQPVRMKIEPLVVSVQPTTVPGVVIMPPSK